MLMESSKDVITSSAAGRIDSLTKSEMLPAPSQMHTDDAQDRAATRDHVNQSMKKWNYLVQRMRTADQIQFPLRTTKETPVAKDITSLTTPLNPRTDLEKKIQETLTKTGLQQKHVTDSDDDDDEGWIKPDVKLSTREDHDDADAGQAATPITSAYLAKLKAVMSYNVTKRKRMNKIRSKAYHRMQRKEKDKEAEKKMKELHEIDPAAAALKRQQQMDKMRALERATMKHKNRSKWVKHVKRVAFWDKDVREALQDESRRHEELTRKMTEPATKKMEEVQDDSSEDDDRRVDQLLSGTGSALKNLAAVDPTDPFSKARVGLADMAFMQRAQQRKEMEMQKELDDLEKTANEFRGVASTQEGAMSMGRKKMNLNAGPTASSVRVVIPQAETNDVEDEEKARNERDAEAPPQKKKGNAKKALTHAGESNVGETRTTFSGSAEHNHVTGKPSEPPSTKTSQQADLIRQAFLADDILAEIRKEKNMALEKDATPLDTNMAMPGWDEWGGADPNLNRRQTARLKRMELKRKIEIDELQKKRRDANLEHVFISENADAIPDKYVPAKVPFPYESAEQYDRATRMPLGPEWNTSTMVEQATRPKVTLRKGFIIEPLDDAVRVRQQKLTKLKRN
eukprot:PhF_6_TR37206/c1_g1_i1/m.54840/K14567/UTP14; U3 small nucleolar RNA-associated protein 14